MVMGAVQSVRLKLAGLVKTVFVTLCVLMDWSEELSSVMMEMTSLAMVVTCVWWKTDGHALMSAAWLSVVMVLLLARSSVLTTTQPMVMGAALNVLLKLAGHVKAQLVQLFVVTASPQERRLVMMETFLK